MSMNKSPLYSGFALLVSLVVLAGGAAKLYRGSSKLTGSGLDPKVSELLEQSDSCAEEANLKAKAITPAFRELMGDFDRMGVVAFRSERREACARISGQFAEVSEILRDSSRMLAEATKHGTNEKITKFLLARSKSHELLSKANTQNMEIIQVVLDESLVDADEIIRKIHAIAEIRSANEKAADEAGEASNGFLKRS